MEALTSALAEMLARVLKWQRLLEPFLPSEELGSMLIERRRRFSGAEAWWGSEVLLWKQWRKAPC